MKPWFPSLASSKLALVVYTLNNTTWKMEGGKPEVQAHCWLHIEVKVGLCTRLCLKQANPSHMEVSFPYLTHPDPALQLFSVFS